MAGERALRCAQGHTYDIAKQGYVNLSDAAQPAHADTAAMVAARSELLGSGRYEVLRAALVAAVPPDAIDVVDVGTGTGHYAAGVLDALPAARALGLDVSVAACRRAARAHPRLGVVTADAWGRLPVADAAVDVLLSVFSPRHPAEFVRVLRPDGVVITVTPRSDHLTELRGALGLLGVEQDKEIRLADAFDRAGLTLAGRIEIGSRDEWSADDAVRSVLMGPNAFHSSADDVRGAVARLDWPRPVTISCTVTEWRC